jgi:hypothetical protein
MREHTVLVDRYNDTDEESVLVLFEIARYYIELEEF